MFKKTFHSGFFLEINKNVLHVYQIDQSTWELDARPELWKKFAIIEVALVGLDSMTTLITLYINVYNYIVDAFDDPLLAFWI